MKAGKSQESKGGQVVNFQGWLQPMGVFLSVSGDKGREFGKCESESVRWAQMTKCSHAGAFGLDPERYGESFKGFNLGEAWYSLCFRRLFSQHHKR